MSAEFTAADPIETPLAHAEIQRVGMPYPGNRYLELRAIYEPYLRDAGFARGNVTRDIAYGTHPLNRLDVIEPVDVTGDKAPVVLFVHGGAFVRGDKGGTDGSEIFDNVLQFFARHGMLGININYRLAPEYRYPVAQEDIAEAIAWVRENAAEYGGDPNNVFLIGHSAGATHVATYVMDERLQLNGGEDGVAGAILMSGVYSSDGAESDGHVYFGDDFDAVAENVPLARVAGRAMPVFVVSAAYDPLRMQREAIRLVDRLCDRDQRCPRHEQVAGHNHYSLMYHINTVDDSIAGNIADFIRQETRNDK
jgi:triacylglycerol lipase